MRDYYVVQITLASGFKFTSSMILLSDAEEIQREAIASCVGCDAQIIFVCNM